VCHDQTSCVRQAKGSVLLGLDPQLGETLERRKERTGASQQESKYGEQHSSRGLGDTARDLRYKTLYITTNNKIYNINAETG
jgi:hypothetical protein